MLLNHSVKRVKEACALQEGYKVLSGDLERIFQVGVNFATKHHSRGFPIKISQIF